jgi:hypothetical protein
MYFLTVWWHPVTLGGGGDASQFALAPAYLASS